MSDVVTVKSGETFDDISERLYGDKSAAPALRRANPGSPPAPVAGSKLVAPALQREPDALPGPVAISDSSPISLSVDGADFTHWTDMSITREIDRIPTITVNAPWEPDNALFRSVFKPFSFADMVVKIASETIFTGVMLSPDPQFDATASRVTAMGYGVTGVLNDCTAPASAFPLEYNNQTLDTIARDLMEPFGISVLFTAPAGHAFEKVSLKESSKVLPFLAKLAKQRNLVISETVNGDLWFLQSEAAGSPVARLVDGQPPITELSASFDPQQYFSHITGIAPTVSGAGGSQITTPNPHTAGALRPFTFQADDTKSESLKEVVDAKIARMFANMVSYSVIVPTWADANGNLWEPNTIVSLLAPRVMVYKETEMLIRSVELIASSNSRTARLNLVLAGAFAGEIPEDLPWVE